jgi:parvulin-like peptidyl-prolyl isomerase
MRRKHLALLLGLVAATGADAATVVMQVNGEKVTDYALGRARRAAAALQQGQPVDEQQAMRVAVDQVVGHVLLVQAAREAGITVDRTEAQRRLSVLRSKYLTAEAFSQALAESGTSEAELLQFEEENILIQRYTETTLGPRVTVTKEEMSQYYRDHPTEFDHPEQVKVQMILASVPKGADDEAYDHARSRIDRAARRLAAGEEFAKVAQEVSDDQSRAKGGEVGWVRRGQLLPELDEAVFELEAGQVTKPIKTKYGFHIMGAVQRRPAGRTSLEEAEPNLNGMLKSMKVRELLAQEVASRRAKATIETLDPAIKAALKP